MSTTKIAVNGYSVALLFVYLLLINTEHELQQRVPAVESFESKEVLKKYDQTQGSDLSLASDHYRFGNSSLKWKWNGSENSFGTANFKLLERDPKKLVYENLFPSSPTLILSIYNGKPQNQNIKISYQKQGVDQVWFSLSLDFKGWRTIRVPFYEMQGNPPNKTDAVDYDYFRVTTNAAVGELFFDDIVFSQYMDNRQPYPDLLVPFIKKDQARSIDHWMPLIENLERLENLEINPIDALETKDLETVQEKLNTDMSRKKSTLNFEEVKRVFGTLGLLSHGSTVLGPPLTYGQHEVFFDSLAKGPKVSNDVKSFGQKIKMVAGAYDLSDNHSEKKKLEKLFLLAAKYFLDQGWQKGASGGTRHHIGYATRELTEAFYMMRNSLGRAGLLTEIGESLQWLNNLGMILDDAKNFHVNIDYLNTQSYYHLMVIFLSENKEKQAALLKAYSHYISTILAQEDEEWGFKPDGSSWHHNGHYPAYGVGAFANVPKVMHTLSGTVFRIAQKGHEHFKKALLTTAEYSQLYDWGFGNAGRHPLESPDGNNIKPLQDPYLKMVYSGNPNGTSKIDRELAATYLRLWGKSDSVNTKILREAGIKEAKMPSYRTLPYGATAIHRRKNWAAIIKGYSKYVWSSEIYSNTNRYGRYPSNGTIELLNEEGEAGSGIVQTGWDWNRYPGATIVYLPLEKLETDRSLLMFLSEQTFTGAARLEDNGVFAMILDESKGSNADGLVSDRSVSFPEKLRAKKSIFSFGAKLICIGTDISSIDKENPVQTNLFQTFLKSPEMPMYLDEHGKVDEFPFRSSSGKWIVDPYGNGYHILSDNSIYSHRKEQHSYHNKYSVRTGEMHSPPRGKGIKETKGNFAAAWLDHGPAPKNASYQYVIYPFLTEKAQKRFGKKIGKDTSYKILRADDKAHIVWDKDSATTGYVVFGANKDLGKGILKEVSMPSIVMLQNKDSQKITISTVQPDLNFPINEKKKNGFTNYSQPVELTLTLKGKWNALNKDDAHSLVHSNGDTQITLVCRHGSSNIFELIKTP